VELAKLYGIEKQVRFSTEKNVLMDSGMAKMYNTFDVYLSASRAEGCGLPILEAQACGVPAIVPDNSAQPEWVRGHGWVVPCSDHIVVITTPQHNKWYLIDVDKAVDALTEAYKNKELRLKYGKESREEMLKYDWDKIVDEQWIPFLEQTEKEMKGVERKVKVKGKTFNIRNGKVDIAVINEVLTEQTYSRFITPDIKDNWLDIGGQIGTFTIDIADKVAKVVTYEPEKDNFLFLTRNIAENKVENVEIVNKAVVGDDSTEMELNSGEAIDGIPYNTGGYSLIDKKGNLMQKVQCENINEIVKKHKINKIKIDCEGSEYPILKALDFTGIEEIILEYHFNILGVVKYEELIELLSKHFKIVTKPQMIYLNGQCLIYCRLK
jgi:FkbM family methyltransferase